MSDRTRGKSRRMRIVYTGSAAVFLSLIAAGCGTAPTPAASPTGSAGPALVSPSATPSAAFARVGADCGMLPRTGPGSFTSLSSQQAVAAVTSNPQFSVFIAAIRKAGLQNRLDRSRMITLFVPENSAFAGLSVSDIKLLQTPGEVQKIIKYHVVASRITPEQISAGGRVTTLEGGSIELSKAGSDYLAGGATVLCGNITTANATIYIINKVLLPPR